MDLNKEVWKPVGYKKPNLSIFASFQKMVQISNKERIENLVGIMKNTTCDYLKVGGVLKTEEEVRQLITILEDAVESFKKAKKKK